MGNVDGPFAFGAHQNGEFDLLSPMIEGGFFSARHGLRGWGGWGIYGLDMYLIHT